MAGIGSRNKTMDVFIKFEDNNIHNSDIKWYLADESLWITEYENYADIEQSIGDSYGSFNWLYDINDTLLFEKQSGKFRLAVISLSGKIILSESVAESKARKISGSLYFTKREHTDFEFDDVVCYVCEKDYLYSCSEKFLLNAETVELVMTADFSFFICQDLLVGWGLNHASKHLKSSYESDKGGDKHSEELLTAYLKALKIWEEDENKTDELVKLLEKVQQHDDASGFAIKECLDNILENML